MNVHILANVPYSVHSKLVIFFGAEKAKVLHCSIPHIYTQTDCYHDPPPKKTPILSGPFAKIRTVHYPHPTPN